LERETVGRGGALHLSADIGVNAAFPVRLAGGDFIGARKCGGIGSRLVLAFGRIPQSRFDAQCGEAYQHRERKRR